MNKIIVIGASGTIGSALMSRVKRSYECYGTSYSTTNAGHIYLNLLDPDSFNFNFINANDIAFFCAGISSPDFCTSMRDIAWNTNVIGTSRLISRLISMGVRVVFLSTDTVYGDSINRVDENSVVNPIGLYAIMKNEIEQQFSGHSLFKSIRISYVVSRDDEFFCYLRSCAIADKPAHVYSDVNRCFVSKSDVVNGLISLVEKWSQFTEPIINFGGPEVLSREAYALQVKKDIYSNLEIASCNAPIDFLKSRPKTINMCSSVFSRLIDRPVLTLQDSIALEIINN